MRFDIISIFPRVFDCYFNESIIKRARKKGLIKIGLRDLRDFSIDKRRKVDDKPYGGGPGMIFRVEPIYRAVKKIAADGRRARLKKQRVILFSAKGKLLTQKIARRLAKYDQLILICGRYEGVDERVAKHIADEELSVGDYILTGGEIPAMIVIDAVSRLLPGVLGKEESLEQESFSEENFLEYPQYTRPENFQNWRAPAVLLSGHHKKIAEWRKKKAKLKIKK